MASYNLEVGAQLWFIQVQQDEGTLHGVTSSSCCIFGSGRPSAPTPSASSGLASTWAPSLTIRTASRPSFLARALSLRRSGCRSSWQAYNHRSASMWRSTIHSRSLSP